MSKTPEEVVGHGLAMTVLCLALRTSLDLGFLGLSYERGKKGGEAEEAWGASGEEIRWVRFRPTR